MRGFPLSSMLVLGLLLAARQVAAQAADGAALYRESCRSCHGPTGRAPAQVRATYPKIPNLADSTFMRGRSEDSVVAVLRHGLGKDMKSFKDKLSATEMTAVAHFVRGLSAAAPKTP